MKYEDIVINSRKQHTKTSNMKNIDYISNAIASALHLLNNEIQCVENEEIMEEYQDVINDLEKALILAKEMATP